MTRLHALAHALPVNEIRASMAATLDVAPTRVIEVGGVTAGIAVPEPEGVRFFSSERIFDVLDGTLFGSVEQATRAARACSRRPGRRSQPGLSVV